MESLSFGTPAGSETSSFKASSSKRPATAESGSLAEIMKIQALDMTAPLQRLQLASAMLREEQKKLQAKLMLSSLSRDDEKE